MNFITATDRTTGVVSVHHLSEYPSWFRSYLSQAYCVEDSDAAEFISANYGSPANIPDSAAPLWGNIHFVEGSCNAAIDWLNKATVYLGQTSNWVEFFSGAVNWQIPERADETANGIGMAKASWAKQHAQGLWFLHGHPTGDVEEPCSIYLGFLHEADFRAFQAAFPAARE